jgi:phage baseplate assembly protein W
MNQSVVSLPFSFNADGGVSYTQDGKKIWQDRILLTVMTTLGERLMRPDYGSAANFGSFEVDTDAMIFVKQSITTAFSKWLKGLTLEDVVGSIDPVDGYLSLDIIYSYGNGSVTDNVSIKTKIFTRTGDVLMEVNNG